MKKVKLAEHWLRLGENLMLLRMPSNAEIYYHSPRKHHHIYYMPMVRDEDGKLFLAEITRELTALAGEKKNFVYDYYNYFTTRLTPVEVSNICRQFGNYTIAVHNIMNI